MRWKKKSAGAYTSKVGKSGKYKEVQENLLSGVIYKVGSERGCVKALRENMLYFAQREFSMAHSHVYLMLEEYRERKRSAASFI
ncbi:hypothetical protein CER18_04295 [Bartonella tribocorum]|uniref:Uncharacterized protein n=1 Tax=Bartonella tribocorum TaxID=85701 RepID=A0A2M6USS2_9HYPH|nr:hypothetical protein CER18_04295 [Bartonella tribocorum]